MLDGVALLPAPREGGEGDPLAGDGVDVATDVLEADDDFAILQLDARFTLGLATTGLRVEVRVE